MQHLRNHDSLRGKLFFASQAAYYATRLRIFLCRVEVEAERQAFQLQAEEAELGIRSATTRLTDEELQEVEDAFYPPKRRPIVSP